jgi:lysophospholipase L1-like esterase
MLEKLWELQIKRFEKNDKKKMPSPGRVLFIGSSTIRFWKSLSKDMSPLKVINRGFGGSQITDVLRYYDRIVTPYKFKGIVFYCGENDIAVGHSSEEVSNNFKKFCERVNEAYSDLPIFFISIKPPKRRLKKKEEMEKLNKIIKEYSDSKDQCNYVDIVPILSENGKIKKGISRIDGIHLNKKGYKLITSVIKPILLDNFAT